MLKERQAAIKAKGFNMIEADEETTNTDLFEEVDFSKMRVGLRSINDALVNLGSYKKVNRSYGDKSFVLNAIYKHDYATMRDISKYFYESSGIYYRLCRYLAFLYRYDWYVTPYINDMREDKVLKEVSKVLLYLDKSEVKRMCGNIALDIMVEGAYYGTVIDFGDKFAILKLPATYCRSRYFSGPNPIVELNLLFFDAYFPTPLLRLAILKTFPKDILKAYVLYKEGKLKGDYPGDLSCWVALDPGTSVRLCLNNEEFPPFVGVIPSIIDLDEAQGLDRLKTMQQLLKIIVQKLPLDKNGELIFDVDEAKDIHNNAVLMLRKAIGVDVLTTFADIIKIDTKDNNSATTTDDLEKVERTVFNNSGISKNLFNAEGNLAVTNSILVDEASIRELPLQFAAMLNKVVEKFNKRACEFRVEMLETTLFNYKEMAKMYKEQASIGYAKMLPQIALGHSQSSILATLMFENEILHLAEVMIPPMSSNTMSGKDLGGNNLSNNNKTLSNLTSSDKPAGRPEKEDSLKSDKTLANRESES